MSQVIETALRDTYRKLLEYYHKFTEENFERETEEPHESELVSTHDEELFEAEESDKGNSGKESAINIIDLYANDLLPEGKGREDRADLIVTAGLVKVKDLPGFKEAVEKFITEIEAGKTPGEGRSQSAS